MNSYMKEALAEALSGSKKGNGGPFGAVIVKEEQIIGRGHNEVLSSHDPTAHAEINAIREASYHLQTEDLSHCILYTTGYPCPMCMSAVVWSNIKEIYYLNSKEEISAIGFRDDFIYKLLKNPEEHLKLIRIQDESGAKLVQEYKGPLY